MLLRNATFCFVLAIVPASASDWLSFGGDPQRTGWAQGEKDITPSNAKDLTLLWKSSLDSPARELNSLTAAIAAEWVVTPKGMKEIVVVGGASDDLFALDAETGKVLWKKTFTAEVKPKQAPFWLCPNALNATPLIAKRGLNVLVFAISSDGKLHTLDIHNGEDKAPPIQFVPAFSKNWSLGLQNNVLYTTVSQGCNGAKSGVYSMDLTSPDKKISFFQSSSNGAGVWGRAGAVISPSGFVYVQTGDGEYNPAAGKYPDTVLQLSAGDLKLVDYFTPSNHAYLTRKDLDSGSMSAVYFKFKDWQLLASGGKEGVLSLLDAKAVGGGDHKTPLFRGPLVVNEEADFAGKGFWGSFATWEDDAGARWLAVPALGAPSNKVSFAHGNGDVPNGSIMAFQVEEKAGKPILTPAWISRDMNAPDPPIVANGVVYAVSTGEFNRQWKPEGGLFNSKERAALHTGNAILYAFDASTGKELFSSGNTMPGWTHFSGISIQGGRIYVTTFDSTVYAFGLKQ
ncbi:MAG TPA: PQQ-binding-like beta-propeller repeat protein [Bryobacteraceae bacterium]|nr:PQQ-binding-like beta-propeller repeat protein [Bryobacteraceae bacterium]